MNPLECRKLLGHGNIIVDRFARHVYYHLAAAAGDTGIYFFDEMVHTFVLKSHGIEHARRGFGHSRIGVAFAGLESSAFYYESAKTTEVDKIGILEAEAECARRGEYGVFERYVPQAR